MKHPRKTSALLCTLLCWVLALPAIAHDTLRVA